MNKIEKLKKLNEIYINNYNEIKQKLELKNNSIDTKLEKLTQNFNFITTKFLDSSISKLDIKNNNKNNNIKTNSYNKINNNDNIQQNNTSEIFYSNINQKKEENQNNYKINSLFDTNVSYRVFLDDLNKSKEIKK